MPGIRRMPGTYPDYPELPEFSRITLGSSENPTAPRNGGGGGQFGGNPPCYVDRVRRGSRRPP
eukprot:3553179-Prymnesium_polylepis.1